MGFGGWGDPILPSLRLWERCCFPNSARCRAWDWDALESVSAVTSPGLAAARPELPAPCTKLADFYRNT